MNQIRLKIIFSILLSISISGNIVTAQKKGKKIAISGYVTDKDFKPVAMATILIDNVDTQVRSDDYGYYNIRVGSDAVSISVVSPNKQVKSVVIGEQTAINFVLNGSDNSMQISQNDNESGELRDLGNRKTASEKLVVPANKSGISGSENLKYNTIYEMVQGTVPGVDVYGKTIRIRGVNFNGSNNDPIFVIDGMISNSIDHILPNTVQSITVLKNGETAIYGSRGTGGVIVITLKKNLGK